MSAIREQILDACASGNIELFLTHIESDEIRPEYLSMACARGHVAIVSELLTHHAAAFSHEHIDTCLGFAITNSHLDVFQFLRPYVSPDVELHIVQASEIAVDPHVRMQRLRPAVMPHSKCITPEAA
jgi:hypothetical protein